MLGSSKTRPLGRSRPNAGQLALAFNIGSLPRFSRASDLCAAALRSRQVSRDAALKRALGLSKAYQIRQDASFISVPFGEPTRSAGDVPDRSDVYFFVDGDALKRADGRRRMRTAAVLSLFTARARMREGFTESSYYMFGPPRAPRATGAQPRSGSVPRAPSRDAAGAFAAEIQLGYPRRQPPPPRPRPLPNDP